LDLLADDVQERLDVGVEEVPGARRLEVVHQLPPGVAAVSVRVSVSERETVPRDSHPPMPRESGTRLAGRTPAATHILSHTHSLSLSLSHTQTPIHPPPPLSLTHTKRKHTHINKNTNTHTQTPG
jgi:hypothetical protein